jgi:glycosyltransferase involved in cell wall biosynthesis
MDQYRILQVISSLGRGGAEHHVLNLSRYLAHAGHQPAVCTISPVEEGLESAFVVDGIPLYRLPLRSLTCLATPRSDRAVRRIMERSGADLLHAHLFHAEAAGAWMAMRTARPLIVTRHSTGLEFGGWHGVAARLYGRRVARCISVSGEAAREAPATGIAASKVVVLPNAVDTARFRPLDERERIERRQALLAELFPGDAAQNVVLVGSAGGLKAVKGYSILMRAAAKLSASASGEAARALRFVIFGDGPERAPLAALSRSLGLEGVFVMPGQLDELESIYPLLDVFVLTSLSEGVPLALLEAMSSGVACAASDVGGVGEVLEGAGTLVSSGDVAGFAAAVSRLAADRALRIEMGRLARVRILERYNLDIWGQRTLDIYRDVLAGRIRRA